MASERLVGGGGAGVGGGRHARVSPTPGRGSKIAYTPCPRSEPPQDLDLPVSARNCLAIPMSSLQTANGPGKGECKLISKAKRAGMGEGDSGFTFQVFLVFLACNCVSHNGPFAFCFRICICAWQSLRFSTDIVLFRALLVPFPHLFLLSALALTCFVCCLMIAGRLLASVSVSVFVAVSVFLLLCLRKWQFTCEFSSWRCQHVTLIAISLSMRNTQIANQFLVQDRQRERERDAEAEQSTQ